MRSQKEIELIRMLLDRLEHVSVDSYWAHRASGIRGSLLELLNCMEAGQEVKESSLKRLVEIGFMVLKRAAEQRIS